MFTFVMVDESGMELAKSFGSADGLLKSHVNGYTKKDGTFVSPYETNVQKVGGEYRVGNKISSGSSSVVYSVVGDADKVFKVGGDVSDQVDVFSKNPSYCPKVYVSGVHHEFNKPYAVLEKLDVESAQKDFDSMINKDRGYVPDWGRKVFVSDKRFHDVRSLLTSDAGRDMLDRVRLIVLATGMKDIHSRNFGYDKNRNLKAIDL